MVNVAVGSQPEILVYWPAGLLPARMPVQTLTPALVTNMVGFDGQFPVAGCRSRRPGGCARSARDGRYYTCRLPIDPPRGTDKYLGRVVVGELGLAATKVEPMAG